MRKLHAPRLAAAALVASLSLAVVAPAALAAGGMLTVQRMDTSEYPKVTMEVSLPPAVTSDPGFTVKENGVEVGNLKAEVLPGDREPVNVVLVMDTSGSMAGVPMDNAKAAAQRFIEGLAAQDRIAIVSFSSEPRVATGFTADRAVLASALGAMRATGETALYDGVATAARVVKAAGVKNATVVLLSDGGDTVSINSLNTAFEAVSKAKLPVFCVALRSPEFNGDVLKKLAKRTGGRFMSAKDSAELSAFYEEIARQLQTRYLLTFTSGKPGTKDIEIDATAEAGGKRWTAQQVIGNPSFVLPAVSRTVAPVEPASNVPILTAIGGLVFLAIGMLVWSIGSIVAPVPTSLRQIGYYEQLSERGELETSGGIRGTMTDAVGYVAGRRGFTQAVHQKLEQAGLPLRATEYMTAHLVFVTVAGLVVQFFGGKITFTLIAIVMATLLPILLLEMKIQKRRETFEAQLPDLLNMLAGSLRAGYALLQAVSLVVEEMLPPASEEFRRVQTEARLGLSVEESLEKMADRLGSRDFHWVVSAINIQREVGGNLAELLDTVAQTIREREAVKRQISALTSEGKLSGIILFVLPFVEAFMLAIVNPGYIGGLVSNPIGLALIGMALLLLVIGALWMKSIINVEV